MGLRVVWGGFRGGLGVHRAYRIQSLGTWRARVYCEILVLSWGVGVSTVYRVV